MIGKSLALATLAAVMVCGAAVNKAGAVVGSPAVATDDSVQSVAWVCGPTRCDWQPWVPGVRHDWARSWNPPRTPGCYWSKRRGRWREVCPH